MRGALKASLTDRRVSKDKVGEDWPAPESGSWLSSFVAGRNGLVLMWAGSLACLATALSLASWYWRCGLPFDVTSGVWTALAKDVADGVLYRPLVSAMGYGGTRYMPLFFSIHGALMRLGMDPIAAGFGLTALSALLLDLALYLTMRELEVRPSLAIPFALLGHATVSVEMLTLGIKGDLLAAALNLLGLALALRYTKRGGPHLLLAGLFCLAAAFFTKLTAISGIVATVAVVKARKGASAAGAVAAIWLLVVSAGLGFLQFLSEGRMWTSFRAVGSGGISASYALKFPFWFCWALVGDPFCLIIVLGALHSAVRACRKGRRPFVVSYFLLAASLTAPVFASPGTDNNHLVDLLGASLLLLAWMAEHGEGAAPVGRWVVVSVAALTLTGFIPGMVSVGSVIRGMGRPERQAIATIVQRAGPADRILSENPLVPVLAGGTPFLTDAFSLRILATTLPSVGADFKRRLERGDFPTVVLVDWSGADVAHAQASLRSRTDRGVDRFYGGVRFTNDFLDLLDRYYTVTMVDHPFVVFERQIGEEQGRGLRVALQGTQAGVSETHDGHARRSRTGAPMWR